MIYYAMILILILLATVIIQFFTIHSWKKNAYDCMKRYDECFTYFEKSVRLCEQMQNRLEQLADFNNELLSRLDKEEPKND